MVSLVSYGVSVPFFRIGDNIIHPQKGKNGNKKSVVFPDEDIVSLGYDSANKCLEKSDIRRDQIDAVFFATTTPVFSNRYHASYVADMLQLPSGILAMDFYTTARSGSDALFFASKLIDKKTYKNILVITSDAFFPPIGEELNSWWGHASCSFLISGQTKGLAEIISFNSFSTAIAEKFIYKNNSIELDSRFGREMGFSNNIKQVLNSFTEPVGAGGGSSSSSGSSSGSGRRQEPGNFDSIILNSIYTKSAGAIFIKNGFNENQFSRDTLFPQIGNTGVCHSLLLLIMELEKGKKNILMMDYTNGTNFFEIKSNGVCEDKTLEKELSYFENIETYQDYLLLRKAGNFNSLNYESAEIFSSEMMQEREKETLLHLNGYQCENCNTIYFLKQNRCKKCKATQFSLVPLSRKGTVFSFTKEYYFPVTFPPVTMVIIDLEGGGRITVQQTDIIYPEKNKLEIGSKVELVLRKMMENDRKPNYFWKCRGGRI